MTWRFLSCFLRYINKNINKNNMIIVGFSAKGGLKRMGKNEEGKYTKGL